MEGSQRLFIQGISSQTVESNLVLREGRTDISDILRQLFSIKLSPILISRLTFPKIKWEIMKNYKILLKNGKKLIFLF